MVLDAWQGVTNVKPKKKKKKKEEKNAKQSAAWGLPLAEHLGSSIVALSADRLSTRVSAKGGGFWLRCAVKVPRRWQSGMRLDGLHKPRRRAGAAYRVFVFVAAAVALAFGDGDCKC